MPLKKEKINITADTKVVIDSTVSFPVSVGDKKYRVKLDKLGAITGANRITGAYQVVTPAMIHNSVCNIRGDETVTIEAIVAAVSKQVNFGGSIITDAAAKLKYEGTGVVEAEKKVSDLMAEVAELRKQLESKNAEKRQPSQQEKGK